MTGSSHLVSRRRFVVGVGAVGVLAGCGARADGAPAPLPPVPPVVHTRWSGVPTGPVPPRGDEGRPVQLALIRAQPPTIEGGALVGHPVTDQQSATHVMQTLDATVRRIGAVFGFDPGSDEGSLGFIAFATTDRVSAPCHVAVTPTRWIASTAENWVLSELGRGSFTEPLVADGRPYRVEVALVGSTLVLALPDGSSARVSGPGVSRIAGPVACWELFQNEPGGAPVRLYESWAG